MSYTFCEEVPSRVEWPLFSGDFERYEESLYSIFKKDFIISKPTFQGKPVDIIHEKYYNEKERSFWHIITKGDEDFRRSFDADRCGSIAWVRPLIESDGTCENYKLWVKWHDQSKRNRYFIWCTKINYLVILEDRDKYFKLVTAFNVLPYSIKRYQKDYNAYIKTKTPT